MLKGIDPRLNADVLGVLRAMGHGDTVIIGDTNFPSDTLARSSTHGKLLRMDNMTAPEVAGAILSVMPLDSFVPDFAAFMQVVDAPDERLPIMNEVQAEVDKAEGSSRPMIGIERFAFYDLAAKSYAVIQTGERRFYGCFMFRKGVIGPDEG